jgi:predicted DNA-binding transcriptional regulator AlpA
MDTNASTSDRIIKLREVITMTGLSRSSIYLLIKKGGVPGAGKAVYPLFGLVLERDK